MAAIREPVLKPIAIADLHPTQMTVGMREVELKCQELRGRGKKKVGKFLGSHMVPVVLGPAKRHYVIDHHHLLMALHREGYEQVLTTVVADFSMLDADAFWTNIDYRNLVHPFDDDGRRRDVAKLPKSVAGLKDDPFRSLAGELRRAGGFAKDTTPYSEFLWADFLRRRLKRKAVEKDFAKAIKLALKLAKSQDARYLPGWCGPSGDD
jgi:hypothetical protein